jgi:hypothetical protein
LRGYGMIWIRGFLDIFALCAARYASRSACGSAARTSMRLRQDEKISLPVQVSSFEVFLVFGESFFEMADSLIKMNKR